MTRPNAAVSYTPARRDRYAFFCFFFDDFPVFQNYFLRRLTVKINRLNSIGNNLIYFGIFKKRHASHGWPCAYITRYEFEIVSCFACYSRAKFRAGDELFSSTRRTSRLDSTVYLYRVCYVHNIVCVHRIPTCWLYRMQLHNIVTTAKRYCRGMWRENAAKL